MLMIVHTFIPVREIDDRISALMFLVPACSTVHQPRHLVLPFLARNAL
jgi:hypothetical protein